MIIVVQASSCHGQTLEQVLVGEEIDNVNNTANLQYSRPFDRGYLTNWEPEYKVWQRVISDGKLKVRDMTWRRCPR